MRLTTSNISSNIKEQQQEKENKSMQEKHTVFLLFMRNEFSIPRECMTVKLYELFARYDIEYKLTEKYLDFEPREAFNVIRTICANTQYRIEVA